MIEVPIDLLCLISVSTVTHLRSMNTLGGQLAQESPRSSKAWLNATRCPSLCESMAIYAQQDTLETESREICEIYTGQASSAECRLSSVCMPQHTRGLAPRLAARAPPCQFLGPAQAAADRRQLRPQCTCKLSCGPCNARVGCRRLCKRGEPDEEENMVPRTVAATTQQTWRLSV